MLYSFLSMFRFWGLCCLFSGDSLLCFICLLLFFCRFGGLFCFWCSVPCLVFLFFSFPCNPQRNANTSTSTSANTSKRDRMFGACVLRLCLLSTTQCKSTNERRPSRRPPADLSCLFPKVVPTQGIVAHTSLHRICCFSFLRFPGHTRHVHFQTGAGIWVQPSKLGPPNVWYCLWFTCQLEKCPRFWETLGWLVVGLRQAEEPMTHWKTYDFFEAEQKWSQVSKYGRRGLKEDNTRGRVVN